MANATKRISMVGCDFKAPKNKNISFQLGSACCHPKLHFQISKMQPRGFQGRGLIRSINATNEDAGKRISMGVRVALKKQGKNIL